MASADHLPVLEAVTSLKMDEAVFFVMVKVIVSLTPVVAAIWYYLPVLLLSALVTGLFTGLCAQLVLKRLRRGAGRKEKGEST